MTDSLNTPVVVPGLGTGWTLPGPSGWQFIGYWKDPNGHVHIRGTVTATSVPNGSVIFTLPDGFRPAFIEGWPIWGNNGSSVVQGVLQIDPDGSVIFAEMFLSSGFISVSGIDFLAGA